MMKKLNGIFIILVCLFALSFMACPDSGGSSDSSSGNSVVGIWEGTTTITDYGIPMVFSASFNLKANNTFTAVITMSAMGMTETQNENGTYSVSGNTITFVDSYGDAFDGKISGKTITISEDGITLVLHKK